MLIVTPVYGAVTGIPTVSETVSALAAEKAIFGDVLLGEDGIATNDSYHTLPQKSTQFFRWALLRPPSRGELRYVLMVDDDVYVDMPGLQRWLAVTESGGAGERRRLYAGEVRNMLMVLLLPRFCLRSECWIFTYYFIFVSALRCSLQVYADMLHHAMKPQRHPSHKNFLPLSAFPFSELPRFAVGNAYVLSGDLVRFVVRNLDMLRPVGDLEDVTLAGAPVN